MNTKQGAHGTLYRYVVRYRDEDPACPVFLANLWAYNLEHAHDKLADWQYDGWHVVSVKRVCATEG